MKKTLFFLFQAATLAFSVTSCKQDDPATPEIGSVVLRFDHVVGSRDLVLNDSTYTNGGGESFRVTTLNYFVSNIRLKRPDGSEFVVPQDKSYFLVKESDANSQKITLDEIPAGEYSAVSFLIGVDSLRSTMDIGRRTGALDPGGAASGMYWDWNSGYIFLKLEGTSPLAPIGANGQRSFFYHVGLFGGYKSKTLNNLRTIQVPFGSSRATVSAGPAAAVTIKGDVLKIFDGVKALRIATNPDIMVSPLSADLANNYAGMFRFDKIQAN
ncbi:MbnP family protein [Larkinella soli]|uniref:MbnP family protein n=1 Tax=Larkinella soli TaxID=1770527 RepID=UPI000FFB5523|nr:MbnP family protein [Larkinella soli]